MNHLKPLILVSLVLGMASWGQSSASVVTGSSAFFVSRKPVDSQNARRVFGPIDDDQLASRKAATDDNSASRKAAAEQLAKALDYFTSQKYHECLIILQPLDRQYRLNPRYRAYLGVCLYYEWEYAEAVKVFDGVLPLLKGLAPQELSLYYWMDAESHFMLQRYREAMPLYEQMLPLCHDNERPDAYYRLGFCHLFLAESSADQDAASAEKKKAKECFEQSLLGYLKYRNTPDEKARIAQIKHMIQGLK